jgi:uncharacterized protein (TIGR02466 family)
MKTSYPIAESIELSFATPIFKRVWPGSEPVNAGLRRIVLAREADDHGVQRSNVGGWHSKEDLLDWPHPEVDALKRWIGQAVRELTGFVLPSVERPMNVTMDAGAWANVCRDGAYNKIHNHPDCTWSGVYYVATGERARDSAPENGTIEFLDPRMGATAVGLPGNEALAKLRVDPVPGMMLLFPCWLYHYVNPFHGAGERISIAFNIRVQFRPVSGG